MTMRGRQDEGENDGGDEADAAAKPQAGSKRFSRKLLIAGASCMGLLAAGLAAYVFFGKGGAGQAVTAAPAKPSVFLDLPDTLVNLSNAGAERAQYLKIKAVLELPDQASVQLVQPMVPRVMDSFQTYLRELRPSDLDGSAGLYRMKEELTRRVNMLVAPHRVNAILFKEVIVQ